nr:hypothetical protein [Tanacetum cinerariifolium]
MSDMVFVRSIEKEYFSNMRSVGSANFNGVDLFSLMNEAAWVLLKRNLVKMELQRRREHLDHCQNAYHIRSKLFLFIKEWQKSRLPSQKRYSSFQPVCARTAWHAFSAMATSGSTERQAAASLSESHPVRQSRTGVCQD